MPCYRRASTKRSHSNSFHTRSRIAGFTCWWVLILPRVCRNARCSGLVDVNHLQGHVLAHFISQGHEGKISGLSISVPLVSGGKPQIVLVRGTWIWKWSVKPSMMQRVKHSTKCAKVMGLPYPGGPHVDRPLKKVIESFKPINHRYRVTIIASVVWKTSFLYLLRDEIKKTWLCSGK